MPINDSIRRISETYVTTRIQELTEMLEKLPSTSRKWFALGEELRFLSSELPLLELGPALGRGAGARTPMVQGQPGARGYAAQ
jgi:hypothetical protein